MRKIISSMLVLGLWALLLPPAGNADSQKQSTGIITGRLINNTNPPGGVDRIVVELQMFGIGEQRRTWKATTDREGRFRFEKLPIGSNVRYLLSTAYKGTEYKSREISFEEGKESVDVPIIVFDTTEDDKAIVIRAHHIFVTRGEGFLEVHEVIIVENRGDRTWIGKPKGDRGSRETFRLPLPAGAFEIRFQQGFRRCCSRLIGEDVVDTTGLKPGLKQYSLSYKTDFSFSEIVLKRMLPYDTDNISVLMPAGQLGIESAFLKKGKEVTFRDRKFAAYSGERLKKGTALAIRFTLPSKQGSRLGWVIAGVALLAVFGILLAVALKRRRSGAPEEVPADGEAEEAEEDVEKLLHKLARLDEVFEEGLISQKSYEEERERLKERIRKISG